MGFIWLTELKNGKEIEICLNLDKITHIYKEPSPDNCQCYQVHLIDKNDYLIIKDRGNHLTNTLFKNKAKE
ncbi:hypothetical protein [Xylocopilactobacillus apicola]|uniref:Uncharacterized protein n=1 Tax=Xylocopilactobacillus apicola TaxID=2932184 RepID=A0AAU9DIM5_9LACO|nr:hypothetical protein [Xylocopilactobacillus apicola]BDR58261.1 hypothetical protein XA3_07020 [Xylocopilactobacillus apicola]